MDDTKNLLIKLEDFSDYNDNHIIFLMPDYNESKKIFSYIIFKLIYDEINHIKRITKDTHFFYISNEDVNTGFSNGELLDTTLYPLDGEYQVYRILADINGNLYLQWVRNINADDYAAPYENSKDDEEGKDRKNDKRAEINN